MSRASHSYPSRTGHNIARPAGGYHSRAQFVDQKGLVLLGYNVFRVLHGDKGGHDCLPHGHTFRIQRPEILQIQGVLRQLMS